MKLKLLVDAIRQEHGYSQSHAYRLAHRILDAIAEMDEAERLLWRRERVLEIKRIKVRRL